jgi:heat shock protein HtpX
MGHFGGGRRSGKDANQIGLILGIAGIVLAILSPIVATLIKLAISRKREFLADASGALLTRYPDGLANALTKIGKYSGRMARANNSSAHLYFSNPFGDRESRAGFVTRLFSTHPPIEERIKVLRAMGS